MEPTTIIESAFMRVVIVDDAPRVRDRVPDILRDLVWKSKPDFEEWNVL